MEKKILLIDDDQLVLSSLSSLFIKNGWSVDVSQSGESGLKLIEDRGYDCILLDIRMPGLTGAEVMQRLNGLEAQGKIKKQNVIIMSGYSDEEATMKVIQLGAFRYVHKPFDIGKLLAVVEACVNSASVAQVFEEPPLQENEEKVFKKIRKLYDQDSVNKKADIIARKVGVELQHIKGCTYDTERFKGNIENPVGIIQVPLGIVGPVKVQGKYAIGDFLVPLATTEGALLLTYDLGSRLFGMSGPIESEVSLRGVHISPMFPIKANEDELITKFVDENFEKIKSVAEGNSRHTKLLRIEKKKVADNFVLKFIYDTCDAQGLNMINQASYNACKFIQAKIGTDFYHRSHYSGVKHHSPLNEREGYGRVVKARGTVSSKALAMLRVDARRMKDFFDRCTACGQAAEIQSVNVHAANALAAVFLACGQDPADISSAHTCTTTVEIAPNGKDLIAEVVLHNLLIATVGGGTGLGTQQECLKIMDCAGSGKANKFAEIIAAIVLAGEIPTAAAVISETYVDIHNKYGRNKDTLNHV